MALFRPSGTPLYVPPTTPPITGSLSSPAFQTTTPVTSQLAPVTRTTIVTTPNLNSPSIFASPPLSPEVLREALSLEGGALLALCGAGSPLCGNEDFWRQKFALDFPGVNFGGVGR